MGVRCTEKDAIAIDGNATAGRRLAGDRLIVFEYETRRDSNHSPTSKTMVRLGWLMPSRAIRRRRRRDSSRRYTSPPRRRWQSGRILRTRKGHEGLPCIAAEEHRAVRCHPRTHHPSATRPCRRRARRHRRGAKWRQVRGSNPSSPVSWLAAPAFHRTALPESRGLSRPRRIDRRIRDGIGRGATIHRCIRRRSVC